MTESDDPTTITCGCGDYSIGISDYADIQTLDVVCPECENHFGFDVGEERTDEVEEVTVVESESPQRINIDFDNTLTESNVKYWAGERPDPDDEMIDYLIEKYRDGHTIIIWTARPWSEAGRIAGHLTEWGVRFHGIRCDKGSADLYIDDKARRPREVTDGGETDE
jgi:hypothetical protein